ncbi:hypothetical protein [Brevundimonas sp.]|uniref:hypothetical protein n=1 Tax=Brevundimonas sp. TaxID=1871086 RepID=UPI003D14793F
MSRAVFLPVAKRRAYVANLPTSRRIRPDTLDGSSGRMIFARAIRDKVLRYLNLRNHSDELFQRFARVDDADWWFRVKPFVEGRMSKGKLAAAILMLGEVEAD